MRALKKGDAVRVVGDGLRHKGWTGTVLKQGARCIWVGFTDGKDAPFSRWELVALPRPTKRRTGRKT